MRASGQAGPLSASSALSRIWACLILRTSALPRANSRSSSSRSARVRVTRYFLCMAGLRSRQAPTTRTYTHPISSDRGLRRQSHAHYGHLQIVPYLPHDTVAVCQYRPKLESLHRKVAGEGGLYGGSMSRVDTGGLSLRPV